MNFSEILAAMQNKLAIVRALYIKVYPGSPFNRWGIDNVEEEKDTFIFYSHEHNEACHCHPEYTRDSFELPKDLANSMDETEILAYLELEKKTKEEKYAREKREQEERERALLKSLEEKYGKGQ